MHKMPGLRVAVLRGVLAHRRNNNSVSEFDLTDSKRIKQFHGWFLSAVLLAGNLKTSLPKQRSADAHLGRALFNGNFKVVGHAHGQNRKRQTKFSG